MWRYLSCPLVFFSYVLWYRFFPFCCRFTHTDTLPTNTLAILVYSGCWKGTAQIAWLHPNGKSFCCYFLQSLNCAASNWEPVPSFLGSVISMCSYLLKKVKECASGSFIVVLILIMRNPKGESSLRWLLHPHASYLNMYMMHMYVYICLWHKILLKKH